MVTTLKEAFMKCPKNPKAMINFDQLIPKLWMVGVEQLSIFEKGNPFLINLRKTTSKLLWFSGSMP
ncbi:hypothetical protein Ct9H90mP12_1690 [bacterium]|nr:MAG: hypothetical protein Ct9H90mP12_1690 [bacterium]